MPFREWGIFARERMWLDLGAGNVRHEDGFETLDNNPLHKPDILASVPPIPLADESCSRVRASHFLEHLDADTWPALIAEVWRVLDVGGTFEIVCPYAFSHGAVQDPTHRTQVVVERFLYWTPHFTYLGYGYEDRFQMTAAAQDADDVRVTLTKTATLEDCICPFGHSQEYKPDAPQD